MSEPTMPTDGAGAYSLFTESFQRRMPLINQHLTAMLKRKENILLNRESHCRIEQTHFRMSIHERVEKKETMSERDSICEIRSSYSRDEL